MSKRNKHRKWLKKQMKLQRKANGQFVSPWEHVVVLPGYDPAPAKRVEKPEVLIMKVEGFKVQVTREVWNRIMGYAHVCPEEISGFGETEIFPDHILIKSAFLIKQKVTPVTTDMDPRALYEEVTNLASQGKDTSNWGLWWHSHANMQAFFSGTDSNTIGLLEGEHPLVALCVNKHGKYYCEVDMWSPFRFKMKDVEIEIIEDPNDTLLSELSAEMKEKVEMVKSPAFVTGRHGDESLLVSASAEDIKPGGFMEMALLNQAREREAEERRARGGGKCLMCSRDAELGSKYCSNHSWIDSGRDR